MSIAVQASFCEPSSPTRIRIRDLFQAFESGVPQYHGNRYELFRIPVCDLPRRSRTPHSQESQPGHDPRLPDLTDMASAISARGAQVIVWSYVTWAIAAFFVILRLIVRWKVVHVIGREDACVFVALVSSLIVHITLANI